MTVRVSVEVEDGKPVVRHVADAADAADLQRTAERIAAAAGPGVVTVLASRALADGWELVTAYPGSPISARAVRTPEHLAAVGAAVASTLAGLHDRGIVHGSVDRAHVLIGADGQPVLTGFASDPGGARPDDDVAGLGRVLLDLTDELALGPRAAEAGALARLDPVLAAAAGPEERRPSARRLATELGSLAEVAPPSGRHAGRRPWVRLVAAVTVIAFGAFFVAQAWDRGPTPRRRPTVVVTTAPPSIPLVARCAASAGHRVDAATCGFEASVERGVVEVDGVRSVVGRDDDVVAVGDWDCDGVAEPAALRPATGEVLVFGPADATGARAVVLSTRVAGAVRFDLDEGEPGCTALRVTDRTGEIVPIEGLTKPIPS